MALRLNILKKNKTFRHGAELLFLGQLNILINNNPELPNTEPNSSNAVALWQSNTQADEHVKSALDVMCEQLDPSINPFDEDFPNYDPNTSTIPVKIFKDISNSLTEQMAKLAKSVVKESFKVLIESVEQDTYNSKASNDDLNSTISNFNQNSESGEKINSLFFKENFMLFLNHSSEAFKALSNFSHDYPVVSYVPMGFLFYRVIKAYSDAAFPNSVVSALKGDKAILKYQKTRIMAIRYFTLTGAPLITMLLYGVIHPGAWEKAHEYVLSKFKESSLLLLSKKTKNKTAALKQTTFNHRNINNKNTIPPIKVNYFLYTLLYLIVDYVLIKISDLIGFTNLIFLYLVFGFIYFIYLIADLCIFIYYIKNKITTPSYLPDFIRTVLIDKEDIVKSGDDVIKMYLHKDIVILITHSITLLLSLIVYFLY